MKYEGFIPVDLDVLLDEKIIENWFDREGDPGGMAHVGYIIPEPGEDPNSKVDPFKLIKAHKAGKMIVSAMDVWNNDWMGGEPRVDFLYVSIEDLRKLIQKNMDQVNGIYAILETSGQLA